MGLKAAGILRLSQLSPRGSTLYIWDRNRPAHV